MRTGQGISVTPLNQSPTDWQILDVGSIWMKEFAAALSRLVRTTAWAPCMSKFGYWQNWERTEQTNEPPIEINLFPLQSGYARMPIDRLFPYQARLFPRLRAHTADATRSALVCTTPFYAPVAELWPGPVVYYVTDLTKKYEGCDEKQVVSLDKRLCRTATLVCPNSRRIAEYLVGEAGCDSRKIVTVPNATRRDNISHLPLQAACPIPASIAHLKRPIVGVIGNLAGNMDWLLLKDAIAQSSDISWVFVGPTSMPIPDKAQSAARRWVLANAHFTGSKPYGELQAYARSFDVAVLPYRKHEPTYSGSSTRFYEHLATSRPMIATRGFAELLEKEPLLTLVDTAAELMAALARLKASGFRDGHEHTRWLASQSGTWEQRAETMVAACGQAMLGIPYENVLHGEY